MLAAALLLLQQPEASAAGDTIVVTAVRRKCSVRLADKVLSDPEFAAHAAEWAAGRPVRVYAPASADYACLAKIAFKLSEKGVRYIHFVDGRSAAAPDTQWRDPPLAQP